MRGLSWTLAVSYLVLLSACGGGSGSSTPADTTPGSFSFVDQSDVSLNTLLSSNAISVSGINTASPVSISGGEYSINGAAFTSASGTVTNGQNITVRQTSSANFSTSTSAVLSVGGVSDAFEVTTLVEDITPNIFSFTDQIDVEPSTLTTSNSIVISSINSQATVTVVGGEYSIDGGAFTAVAGTVSNGQSLAVRTTSSANFGGAVDVDISVGTVSDTFSVTTRAANTTPASFSFVDQSNIALSTLTESNTLVITGLEADANLSITGGEYSINGAAYTSAAGTIADGQNIKVRQTSSNLANTTTDTVLTIGGVSDTFSVATVVDNAAPTATILFPSTQSISDGANVIVRGSATDNISVITAISVNGIAATTSDSFATWTATVPLALGLNSLDVSATDEAGNTDANAAQVIVQRSSTLLTDPREVLIDTAGSRAIVVDSGSAAILTMDLTTGARAILSANGIPADSPISSPRAIGIDANNVYVLDEIFLSLFAVDLTSGAVTLVSGIDIAGNPFPDANNLFAQPVALTIDSANNRALVLDANPADPNLHSIIAVDLSVGANFGVRTILSDGTTPNNTLPFNSPTSIAIDTANTRALVTDSGNAGRVIAVDLTPGATLGARSLLTTGGTLAFPVGITLDTANTRALVSVSASDGSPVGIQAVRLDTGVISDFSNATTPDTANVLIDPMGLTLDSVTGGRALIADRTSQAIFAVNLTDGTRSIVSDGKENTPNDLNVLQDPQSVVLDKLNNRLFITEPFDTGDGIDSAAVGNGIIEVNIATGERSVFVAGVSGGNDRSFQGLALDTANDRLLATHTGTDTRLIAIDLQSKVETIISDSADAAANPFTSPGRVILDSANTRAVIIDAQLQTMFMVNLSSGTRTVLSSPTFPDAVNVINSPFGGALDILNDRVLVVDSQGFNSALIAVSLSGGARTVVSANGIPDANNQFVSALDVAFDENTNTAYVVDAGTDALYAVTVNSGVRTLVSDLGLPNNSNVMTQPWSVVVDPVDNLAYVVDKGLQSILLVDLISGDRVFLSR
ncbi:hypothetical protein NBRC116493_20890 [Aurantivibrio infirmus]